MPRSATAPPAGLRIPTPGHEAKIADPLTGEEQPDGQVGEIWVRGPRDGRLLAPPPADRRVDPAVGWLRTGDAGYRDGDG